jgi:hypothetical protein
MYDLVFIKSILIHLLKNKQFTFWRDSSLILLFWYSFPLKNKKNSSFDVSDKTKAYFAPNYIYNKRPLRHSIQKNQKAPKIPSKVLFRIALPLWPVRPWQSEVNCNFATSITQWNLQKTISFITVFLKSFFEYKKNT